LELGGLFSEDITRAVEKIYKLKDNRLFNSQITG
jgi:hypothetical protein